MFSRTPLPGAAPSTQFEAAYRKQSRNSRSEDARAKLQRFALGRFFPFTRPGLIGVRSGTVGRRAGEELNLALAAGNPQD